MSANVWEPGSSLINVNAETTNRSEVFGAYAGQSQFNLTDFTYTVGTESIAVYKNGQKLIRDVDFEEVDSDTVYLTTPCEDGDVVEVVAIIGSTDANAQLAQQAVTDCQAIRDSVANWPVVDYLSFSAAGSSDAERKLTWNDTDGTLNLGLKGGNVVLQVGQEEVVRVYNQTGTAFTDGQVLYITGSQGQRLTAGLARANAEATSNSTIAVVTEPTSNNAEGFATVSGLVRGLNTTAFNEGDTLYLSAATAGALTKVKPTAPDQVIRIGWCVRSHSSQGVIYVNVHHEVSVSGLIADSGYSMSTGKVLGRSSTGTGAIEELTQLPSGFLAGVAPAVAPKAGDGAYIRPLGVGVLASFSPYSYLADCISFVPILLEKDAVATHVCCYVNTVSTGTVRLALYGDNSGFPGTLVVDASTASTSTAGSKELALGNISLKAGLYWLAIQYTGATDGAILYYGGWQDAAATSYIDTGLGFSLTPPYYAFAGVRMYAFGWAAFPTTPHATTKLNGNTYHPLLYLKLA